MPSLGTRASNSTRNGYIDHGSETRSHTRDVGLSKNITASITFGSGQISAANGTFSAFTLQDPLLIEGANLNNGFFTVTGVDTVNHSYLMLTPSPKSEGPITATVRTR